MPDRPAVWKPRSARGTVQRPLPVVDPPRRILATCPQYRSATVLVADRLVLRSGDRPRVYLVGAEFRGVSLPAGRLVRLVPVVSAHRSLLLLEGSPSTRHYPLCGEPGRAAHDRPWLVVIAVGHTVGYNCTERFAPPRCRIVPRTYSRQYQYPWFVKMGRRTTGTQLQESLPLRRSEGVRIFENDGILVSINQLFWWETENATAPPYRTLLRSPGVVATNGHYDGPAPTPSAGSATLVVGFFVRPRPNRPAVAAELVRSKSGAGGLARAQFVGSQGWDSNHGRTCSLFAARDLPHSNPSELALLTFVRRASQGWDSNPRSLDYKSSA